MAKLKQKYCLENWRQQEMDLFVEAGKEVAALNATWRKLFEARMA